MAETEVESTLREIRERVLSEQRAGRGNSATRPALTNGDNGGESVSLKQVERNDEPFAGDNLSLINSYLTTTARAWDRLPPLLSNRSRLSARLELWLKRQLKRATHWFTWEQVNFNAAIHHAVRDLLPVLTAHEHQLAKLRVQLPEADARRTELEQYQAALSAQLGQVQAELQTEIDSQRNVNDAQKNQFNARIQELVNELRERDERLQEEGHVCFKQIALETSEAAVLEDRARRKTEAKLEELLRRVEQLEKKPET